MDILLMLVSIITGLTIGVNYATSLIAEYTAEKVSYILDTKNIVLRRKK